MPKNRFLRHGYDRADRYLEEMGDKNSSIHHEELMRKGFICPVCGKRAYAQRPEGIMHKSFKAGVPTTYCKIKGTT